MSITTADIDLLIREPSAKRRAGVAEKIAVDYNTGLYRENERELAHDIFRLLLKDVEVRVRRTISEQLHQNLGLPRDLLLRMAQDVAEVAVPVLEHSYGLTEEDLIEIVRSTKVTLKLEAIAGRPSVSRSLAKALMDTRHIGVITTLFANRCASLEDDDILETAEAIRFHPAPMEALVERGGLSLVLVEKIFLHVSEELRTQLTQRYRLAARAVGETTAAAHEWGTLTMISKHTPVTEVYALMDRLHATGRLTHSMVLRSLCTGDLRFFEAAMAKLAGIPFANTALLMLDPGVKGFKAVYEKAGLPAGFFDAVRALHVIAQEETDWGRVTRDDYRKRIVSRLVSEGHDKRIENVAYLVSIIGDGTGAGNDTIH